MRFLICWDGDGWEGWLVGWTEVSSRLGWRWLVQFVGRFGLRFLVGWDGDGW
jgi:hypothetical protein